LATVLILSEDVNYRLLYEKVLEVRGHNHVSVSSRQDTLSHLKSSGIDVLFIVGPHQLSFDGWEFYKQLKSSPELCNIPVIIYTPLTPPSDFTPNPSNYGDTLFTMPLSIDRFVKKLQEVTGIEKR